MNAVNLTAIWHDVECGSYDADLELWEELVGEGAEIVDLGCGTGRVATHLARRGRKVTAVDRDPHVLEVLERRTAERGLAIACVCQDVCEFNLGRQFDAVLAPMQLVQLMRGERERKTLLTRAVRHVRPGGLFAATLMNLEGELVGEEYGPPPPDMREIDGWMYSSQSVAVILIDSGRAIAIDRIRTAVAPDGEQQKSMSRVRLELVAPDSLEGEMQAAGLVVHDRRIIPPTDEHVGSIVVIGTAPRGASVSLPALRVMWLYPDHMNIYADRGNISVLEHRCRWRGIGFELGTAGPGDTIDPDAHDLYYMGGGQDRDQALVTRDLADTKRDSLAAAVDSGATFLAVCGGYQLLGHSYEVPGSDPLPGLGLVDLRTVREPGERLIGNVLIEAELGDGPQRIAGFENHGGRTYLGDGERPLGRVVSGFGNNGKDGAEGVRRGKLIGTYLHGPLLPKNAWLADVLICWALERRTGEVPELAPLDDELERAAHESAVRAALRS